MKIRFKKSVIASLIMVLLLPAMSAFAEENTESVTPSVPRLSKDKLSVDTKNSQGIDGRMDGYVTFDVGLADPSATIDNISFVGQYR
ncbi:hypothetical protein ACFQ5D_04845 [Paenibacillus farraposensis]|uniref:Uncharacterized protein n=1 Tax=Paenibacillus farraposensis TaxID=2807095 RepID=A0ABW4DAI7_9BACL|nr:hypothetical protein [Paenibacillus farraposensis]MCC3379043.1 hypothetical protein [Paenibacillus farraposensis]